VKLLRVLVLLSLSLLLCGPASALTLNKDFWNKTGQLANDCEIILDGCQAITCHYDGDPGMEFPVFTVTCEEIGGGLRTVLRWSGLTVAPNAKVHLGFCSSGGTILGMRWTRDGVPIGAVTQLDLAAPVVGTSLVLANTLTYSLWPVTWPILPPPVYVGGVTVYYFASPLPLASLNNTMLPAWSPVAVNVLRAGMTPALALGSAEQTGFTDPAPPAGAGAAVWVVDVNSEATTVQPSRDFVQFALTGPTAAPAPTWGRIKSLYR
jgi:hypothetical protein